MYAALVMRFSTALFVIACLIIYGTSSTLVNVTAIAYFGQWMFVDYRLRYGGLTQRHIPIVPSWPILGPLPYIDIKFAHTSVMRWRKKLGPVFRFPTAGGMSVIACDYESIRDVCITKARAAGGRPMPFITGYILKGTGILFSHKNDITWKSLRMASQKHLKQFGDGWSSLEHVITDVAEEMFSTFDDSVNDNKLIDPKPAIFDAALNTMAFLITGVRNKAGDPIIEKMRTYESTVLRYIGAATDPDVFEYDFHPWLRHLRLPVWKKVEDVKALQDSIWEDVQKANEEHPDNKSLFKVLVHQAENARANGKVGEVKFTEQDIHMTVVSLLLAGVTTTSTAFYSVINILAHRKDIQGKLYAEVKKVGKASEPITLADREYMPYCRAVLFELLRYASVVPLGVPHRSIEEVEIGGMKIPEDLIISANIWALHHDPDFWADPYTFIPERFLDEHGELVQADNPNRKHLMPFGAGARVCLGEGMALARLFLWIASFSQRYQVYPAEDNLPEKCDARNYEFDGVVRVCPYNVKLVARDEYHH